MVATAPIAELFRRLLSAGLREQRRFEARANAHSCKEAPRMPRSVWMIAAFVSCLEDREAAAACTAAAGNATTGNGRLVR